MSTIIITLIRSETLREQEIFHLSYIFFALYYSLYNGRRDSLSILTWITTFFPKKVYDLKPSEYREVLNSKHTWIVEFYVPRCSHCQRMEPQFAIAAQVTLL